MLASFHIGSTMTITRSSGRVGDSLPQTRDQPQAPPELSSPKQILILYQKLVKVRGRDGDELSRAIAYALKIAAADKQQSVRN